MEWREEGGKEGREEGVEGMEEGGRDPVGEEGKELLTY